MAYNKMHNFNSTLLISVVDQCSLNKIHVNSKPVAEEEMEFHSTPADLYTDLEVVRLELSSQKSQENVRNH